MRNKRSYYQKPRLKPNGMTNMTNIIYILTGKTDGINLDNTDMNGDGKADVADLVLLINKVK